MKPASKRRTPPWLKPLGSLKLTVTLLAFSVALVFFGTLEQVHIGIRGAQKEYFESLFAVWAYPVQWPAHTFLGWIHLPLPGGYLIGPLLLVNLVAAHFIHFRARWDKLGIAFIHAGIALLLIGQLITQLEQEEYSLWLDEGEQKRYLEHFTKNELAIVEALPNGNEGVTVIPTSLLAQREARIQAPSLPFRIEVRAFYPNARIFTVPPGQQSAPNPVNRGLGAERNLVAQPAPEVAKMDERNVTTAIIELFGPQGSLGVWMVSNVFRPENNLPPQTVTVGGRTFTLDLRFKRRYLPAAIELLDFTHDRYPGTEIPLNFASTVRIHDPDTGEDRQTLIYMNHPLRYAGLTFYQASFGKGDTASMFQVVDNPGRHIPYIASLVVSLGLVVQFTIGLFRARVRRRAS